MNDQQVLSAEHQIAVGQHATLIEIRFKLLAFVPTVTAIAVTAVKDHDNSAFPIAAFGLLVTLGVVMYEVRNSELHDDFANRVQGIERRLNLGLPKVSRKRKSTFGFKARHHYALALIYGSCVGAWAALALFSGIEHIRGDEVSARGTPGWLLAAVAVAFLVFGTATGSWIIRARDEARLQE